MWTALPDHLPMSPRHRARRTARPHAPSRIDAPMHAPLAWLSESALARDLAAHDGRPFTQLTFARLRQHGGAPPHSPDLYYQWGSAVRWAANTTLSPGYFK